MGGGPEFSSRPRESAEQLAQQFGSDMLETLRHNVKEQKKRVGKPKVEDTPLSRSHQVLAARRAGQVTQLEVNERLMQERYACREQATREAAEAIARAIICVSVYDILFGDGSPAPIGLLGESPVALIGRLGKTKISSELICDWIDERQRKAKPL